jgi:Predicted membrane protein (DUF2142)
VQHGERGLWFVFAALFFVAITAWDLSAPLFSFPDESAHVVRAESVVRGQLLGRYVGYQQGRYVYPYYAVSVPSVLQRASQEGTCLAFQVDQPASACRSDLTGPPSSIELTTYVGTYPPLYYLLVGLPTLAWPGTVGIFAMRVLSGAIDAAFLASAVMSALVARRGRVAAIGVLAALTPAALYVSSGVNPAGLEICTAISLWAAGLALVTTAAREHTSRLVLRAGLAAGVLVWSRALSPLWLACIAVTLLVLSDKTKRRSLGRRRDVRTWSVVVGLLTAGALAWDFGADAFQVLGKAQPADKSNFALLGEAFGRTWTWFQGAVGDFGAVDHDTAPTLLLVLSIAVIGFLLVGGWLTATRRQNRVLLGLICATLLLPVLITFGDDRRLGVVWQGRYVLPLAVGIPMLAALLVANGERRAARRVARFFDRYAWGPYVALAAANVIGLLTTLHRFIDGSNGPFDFVGGKWQPPVNAVVLILVFASAQAILSWTLYRVGRLRVEPTSNAPGQPDSIRPDSRVLATATGARHQKSS